MTSPVSPATAPLPNRRTVIQSGLAACALAAWPSPLPVRWNIAEGRPSPADRHFTSPAIEEVIDRVRGQVAEPSLGAMFTRCFPNTLDTTVFPGTQAGQPDTFVITGDIDAMWLRDSSAQVWPYLPFAKRDKKLAALLAGIVRRQARNILLDPYANAFLRSPSDPPLSWAVHDKTEMKPGVGERKWEVDSLCYTIRLAHGYWSQTGDRSPFDAEWKAAAWKILATFHQQQRLTNRGPYFFQRPSANPLDTLPLDGYGNPARPVGLIFSMFRPSDDACTYPLFIPANLFAIRSLAQMQELATGVLGDSKLAGACEELLATLRKAMARHGFVQHPVYGQVWAYEVDGYGNTLLMDDANAPGLLSLPYLDCCDVADPVYQNTRRFVLSRDNPYFFEGSAAQGGGSPHTGLGQIWPMAILLRALTSTDEKEILQCLRWLRNTTAGTEFMHESFDANDPAKFTRPWFAWANTLFGELILRLADQRPALLRERLD
ncbi:MAG TPA: glycoside hydrolase family 125 protein [Acidobacteriaceae bacterium]|nr:glycoside hydrolase family 125 protein [Acidobacteriaceae bacterium]